MPNPYFSFKQFTVWHDRCAMKVGTDGVLLGAWAPVDQHLRLLDVGTGTGLIALQLAQRTPEACITALEIDPDAAQQAHENVEKSPWAHRIKVMHQDFRTYTSPRQFDLIVSNPPYFVNSLKCPDQQRNTARHTDGLSYDLLFRKAATLLQPKGVLSIIVPAESEKAVMDAAGTHEFYEYQRTSVFTKPGKPCRRLLLTFGFDPLHLSQQEVLYISQADGTYSEAYIALTRDFYMNM